VGAALGILFIVGRAMYARAYVAEPKTREMGVILTLVATVILLLGGLIGALIQMLH
jgi:uncharacterized membrane protein YecN with MAPEG domain